MSIGLFGHEVRWERGGQIFRISIC